MRLNSKIILTLVMVSFSWVGLTPTASAARIKDLVDIQGVRPNSLTGYGLVMGLSGTGDTRRSLFTNQSVSSLLRRFGIHEEPNSIDVTNVAAVIVQADLPGFSANGQRIDVTVSSMGDARSIEGGTLVATSLRGMDGKTYAVASGPISVGGYASGNRTFSRLRRNVPTVGRIPAGGLIEQVVPANFVVNDKITLTLREPDFTTSSRIADAINAFAQAPIAQPAGPGSVVISVPDPAKAQPVVFLAAVEILNVEPDTPARIVVNERTGTVVVGGNVTLGAAAVAHGNLDVAVELRFGVSQPTPYAPGGTVIVPAERIRANEEDNKLTEIQPSATVNDLVKALNVLGASPRDLIAILQSLKASGALRGTLVVQ
jgi:flagellar P-ring protein precursor FlgI